MKLTNIQMDNYINSLGEISEKVTGKLAYAVAKNIRKMSDELVEYQNLKNKAIVEHGAPNEQGTYSIQIGSPEHDKYLDDMKDIMAIEHEVPIMLVSQEDVLKSSLNAKEMYALDFMIEEETHE